MQNQFAFKRNPPTTNRQRFQYKSNDFPAINRNTATQSRNENQSRNAWFPRNTDVDNTTNPLISIINEVKNFIGGFDLPSIVKKVQEFMRKVSEAPDSFSKVLVIGEALLNLFANNE